MAAVKWQINVDRGTCSHESLTCAALPQPPLPHSTAATPPASTWSAPSRTQALGMRCNGVDRLDTQSVSTHTHSGYSPMTIHTTSCIRAHPIHETPALRAFLPSCCRFRAYCFSMSALVTDRRDYGGFSSRARVSDPPHLSLMMVATSLQKSLLCFICRRSSSNPLSAWNVKAGAGKLTYIGELLEL